MFNRIARLLQRPPQRESSAEAGSVGPPPVPRPAPLGEPAPWQPVGDGMHPDPEGREWLTFSNCPVCRYREVIPVVPWNKLITLATAPDSTSARYDYAVCRACGILSAMRRPSGARYRFLLEHFGEVTAKRGEGADIVNPVLNPYPLTDADRDQLRRLAAAGAFVSDHRVTGRGEHLTGLLRDRFESAGHVDLIGALLQPRNARVLEVRPKTGAILDSLRRYWNADVYAMPIWESQQFLSREVYGIPTSDLIDFDHFRIPHDEPFDLIVCQHMLTHIIRPIEFFAELRRCLKPGGHLYIHNEPDDAEFLSGTQSLLATLNPLHMQAFDQDALMRGLAANGFHTEFITRRGLTHVCLARVGDLRPTKMDRETRKRRLAKYRKAYDRALLRLDEPGRSRVGADWPEAVERALAAGTAELDAQGRVRILAPARGRRKVDRPRQIT